MPFSVPRFNPTLFYKTHPIIMGLFRQDFPPESSVFTCEQLRFSLLHSNFSMIK